jgi:hypothetical protein
VALPLVLLTAIYLAAFAPRLNGHAHPMGGDYSYFLPRLLANHFWFRLNSWWSVPWFTPGFCGGMPEWANPQSMPYSLPEWLLFFVDPVTAVELTFVLCAMASVTGSYLLLRKGFQTSAEASVLGAAVFLFNGFFICRMFMGHLAFHTFVLTPWVALLLVVPTTTPALRWLSTLAAGVLVAVMIQGGAVAILPPLVVAWLALTLMSSQRGASLQLGFALLLGASLSASKLVAMGALAAQFPRDYYPLAGFGSVADLLRTTFESVFLHGRGSDGSELIGSVVRPSVQERQFSVSPFPLVLLAAALFRLRRPRFSGRALLLTLLLALPLLLNLYTPAWNAFLKQLPIIKANVTLFRWVVLYIPVLAVAAGLALDRLPWRLPIAVISIVGIVGWSLTTDRAHYDDKPYAPKLVMEGWERVQGGEPIPPIGFMDVQTQPDGRPLYVIGGDDVVALGASHVFCYEPIFGYLLEKLPWKPLHAGSPLDAAEGLLNVKNPACELYPTENGCRSGDHFTTNQEAQAQSFLSWEPFAFSKPLKQTVADWLSIATLVGVAIAAGSLGLRERKRRLAQGARGTDRAAST